MEARAGAGRGALPLPSRFCLKLQSVTVLALEGTMLPLLILQALVPGLLLAWLAFGRPPSRLDLIFRWGATVGYLVAVANLGLWLALPRFILWVLVATFPLAAVAAFFRASHEPVPPPGGWVRPRLLGSGALAVVALGVACMSFVWRGPAPEPAVDLSFPLRGGTFYVANGGGHRAVNTHMAIPEHAMSRYRGQIHGVDLVRVDGVGRRSKGWAWAPSDPEVYSIFGDTVYAPCPGEVVAAEDGLPDLRPPEADRGHMAGNHVVLSCSLPEEVWILLAHLKRNSVLPNPGETVFVGDPLGLVGNSGNSGEPHLHIHAQRPGSALNPMGAEPIPVRFGGRSLGRNQRIRR